MGKEVTCCGGDLILLQIWEKATPLGVIQAHIFQHLCSYHIAKPKAVLGRRRSVFFPSFVRWFDFAEEWVMSIAVNLKSYSHHHWPSKVVILFFQELAVVTNKPWSKCGCLCSHITLQVSTHARTENADTGDHTTPLPFLVNLPFDLISGRGSGKRFQYWAQMNSWFIIGSANLAKLQRRVEVQTYAFCKHPLLSNTPHQF